jgi:hypothetical protein
MKTKIQPLHRGLLSGPVRERFDSRELLGDFAPAALDGLAPRRSFDRQVIENKLENYFQK